VHRDPGVDMDTRGDGLTGGSEGGRTRQSDLMSSSLYRTYIQHSVQKGT
jgi:hypothetical protein